MCKISTLLVQIQLKTHTQTLFGGGGEEVCMSGKQAKRDVRRYNRAANSGFHEHNEDLQHRQPTENVGTSTVLSTHDPQTQTQTPRPRPRQEQELLNTHGHQTNTHMGTNALRLPNQPRKYRK